MKRYFLICLVSLLIAAAPANARDLDRWNTHGAEAKVCTEATGGWCITLTCGLDGNLALIANGRGLGPGSGSISVDRRNLGNGRFGGSQNKTWITLNPNSNRALLSAMAAGSRLGVAVGNASVSVSLKGSSKAISHVVELCTRDAPPKVTSIDKSGAFARLENEHSVVFDEELNWFAFSTHKNMDVWGGDIRTGLQDPLLAGISQNQCARLCQTTEGCGAYTYNDKDGDVCFLKTGAAKMRRYDGATTGVRNGTTTALHAPATRGPMPRVDETVAWQARDLAHSHSTRVRAAAAQLGRSCNSERADLAELTKGFTVSLAQDQISAGSKATIHWSGNTLVERVPVWFVVSSKNNVRFDGSAAMVLGPAAPNPFGLETAIGETRAMVSLWGRGAGQAGQIDITPLMARDTAVDVHLVAWLRQCEEEVVLSTRRFNLDVKPAKAILVIGTPASRADMTHSYDIPAFDRRVEFGPNRFRIITLSDQAEIVERDGRGLRLSPTERFVLVSGEVVDVLDGQTVASVQSPSHWLVGDSFIFGSTAPWGAADLASTFGKRTLLKNQITSPSCCDSNPDNSHLAIDLENGLFTLRGSLGHAIGPIQGVPYASEKAQDGYGADGHWSAPTQVNALYALGPVSPVSVGIGFSAAGLVPIGPELRERATFIPLVEEREDMVIASLFRGSGEAAVSAFERIGIELMAGIPANDLFEPRDGGLRQETDDAHKNELKGVLAAIRPEADWRFDVLRTPSGIYNASDCFHFLAPDGGEEAEITGQFEFAEPGSLALPYSIAQVSFIDSGDASLLLGRMHCQAGATAGSLRGQSYFFAVPMRKGAQPKLLVDHAVLKYGYLANAQVRQFQDFEYKARLFGTRVLAHNNQGGGILLFDAQNQEVIHEWSGVAAGSLMIDAFMTADQSHVVQMNSDGGFFVYRITDGSRALSGRIVDDEVAVWAENFHFDATAEAAALIDLRFPGLEDQFSLDRFGAHLAVSGLAQTVLHGGRLPARSVPPPPDLKGRLILDGDLILGSAELDPNRDARELRLYQDGVLTKVQQLDPKMRQAKISAPRLPGARHSSMLAVNADGLASNPVTADLGTEKPGGIRRALAVAVDLYRNPALADLNYAKADADRFMGVIKALPDTVPGFETAQFVGGRRVTPKDVLGAIETTLTGLGPADHAVLFFAGHGLRDANGDFYLALSGTDPSNLLGTAVAWSDVARLLAASEARITILIDACHSGAAGTGLLATNDGVVRGLSDIPANLTILAASKGRQQSIEARSQSGGLFTVALERVLVTERAAFDTNGNSRVEASELATGVARIVSTQSEGRQVPWMTKGRVVGDYSLF